MLAIALAAAVAATAAAGVETPVQSFVEIPAPLKGTMLAPAAGAKAPAALILPGSGPTDRDGNSPLGVKGSTYRLLAEGLAAQGVTTVRMDKRGQFASGAAAADGNKVFIADLAADANTWAADLKKRTGAPCVWLIGHSEGALVAEVAGQTGKDLCGLVLVSGAGERLSDTLRRQLKAGVPPGPLQDQSLKNIATLEAGGDVDASGLPQGLQMLFAPQVQPFLKAVFAYDPPTLLKAYKGPVLIVQGKTDIQITPDNVEALKRARPDASLVELDGVNHLLKVAPLDRAGNLATYADPSLPLAPGVAEAIADFIKSHPG
ncbi:putative alpha/beta hydrolase [Caulobacter sp. AP07]|uniref:alpha/beta hydrolase n=1 Tax=Caulobacter sp. AP07 TaxID=1144304 RepID=UPI000271FCE9|nr:alpha/beta fold hydrolase [Caulobacter sp. AP07]EJL25499.1 putative alpha/beta hydrolase [Caulobacter sp. AP07]